MLILGVVFGVFVLTRGDDGPELVAHVGEEPDDVADGSADGVADAPAAPTESDAPARAEPAEPAQAPGEPADSDEPVIAAAAGVYRIDEASAREVYADAPLVTAFESAAGEMVVEPDGETIGNQSAACLGDGTGQFTCTELSLGVPEANLNAVALID